jgi:hypothetical protein
LGDDGCGGEHEIRDHHDPRHGGHFRCTAGKMRDQHEDGLRITQSRLLAISAPAPDVPIVLLMRP